MTDDTKAKGLAALVIVAGFALVAVLGYLLISAAFDWPGDPTWWAELEQHQRDSWLALLIVASAVFARSPK